MNLYAYTQIGDFEELASKNGIEVPRLRGYLLMSNEESVPVEEFEKAAKEIEIEAVKGLVTAFPKWATHPAWYTYNSDSQFLHRRYLKYENSEPVGIRWDRIHGKKRKNLKFRIKKNKKRCFLNWQTWNKYIGRQDVLYIHARIGGANWLYYGGVELEKQPWFLERVDDPWDTTYCDIYAKLDKM